MLELFEEINYEKKYEIKMLVCLKKSDRLKYT